MMAVNLALKSPRGIFTGLMKISMCIMYNESSEIAEQDYFFSKISKMYVMLFAIWY